MIQKLLWIFLGSGVGGVLRYTFGGLVHKVVSTAFPLGTLAVNVIGCLLIGFLTFAVRERFLIREEYSTAVLIGLLGGFTTFSTFGMETFGLLNDGQYARASLNIVLSVVGGLAAAWIGYRLAEGWLGVR